MLLKDFYFERMSKNLVFEILLQISSRGKCELPRNSNEINRFMLYFIDHLTVLPDRQKTLKS